MPADKKSDALAAWDRWLDRQDLLIAKSQRCLDLSLGCGLAGSLLQDLKKKIMDPPKPALNSVRRVVALQDHLKRFSFELAAYHSSAAAADLPPPSDVLYFVKQVLFFIDRGDISSAEASLTLAAREDLGSHDKNFLIDALRLLADANLTKDDLELQGIFVAKARMSVQRFLMPTSIASELGRIREPTFASSSERELYRYFRKVGRATFKEIEAAFGISESTARRRLEPLIAAGVLERLDMGPSQPVEFALIE